MIDHKNPAPNPSANPPKNVTHSADHVGPKGFPDSLSANDRKGIVDRKGRDDRPTQADIDLQRLEGAESSGNWRREEGEVIGENPASIDFVGAYPWPNVGEPGENRDDATPLYPPVRDEFDVQETMAEEQRRKSDMDVRASAEAARRNEDSQLDKDYPINPAVAFRAQREKDAENDKRDRSGGEHSMNRPVAEPNRPHA